MNLAILSAKPRLYSTQRLYSAAQARGHAVTLINPLHCRLYLANGAAELRHKRGRLGDCQAVIPRIGGPIAAQALAVLRQMQTLGVLPLNSANAISQARDKLCAMQILLAAKVPVPDSAFAVSPAELPKTIHQLGGTPVVIKLLQGSQGVGVMLADTRQAARQIMDTLGLLRTDVLVQRYVAEAAGRDVRVWVIGDQVVAAIERRAAPGEFRANLHRGGRASPTVLSTQEQQVAVAATQALGLSVAGVDLLRSTSGPLVIEVNASPGLEGIEQTTGMDIAGKILDHLEQRVDASR